MDCKYSHRLIYVVPLFWAILAAQTGHAAHELQDEQPKIEYQIHQEEEVALAPVPNPDDAYIKRSPQSGAYDIWVMGDSLADGAWIGLKRQFNGDETVRIEKKSRVNTGIVRSDRFDWNDAVRNFSTNGEFQIAVLMFGANDLQSIRAPGRRHHFKTDGWYEHYIERIDAMLADLTKSDIAVYWIGLPIVKKPSWRGHYAYINEIFRDRAQQFGVKFIDVWGEFADGDGDYTAYGIDVRGKQTKLRAQDGVHFTTPGYEKLAKFVADEIRKDMEAAHGRAM